MKYFVSWTPREPIFQEYDPECNVIVSPANVPLNWSISNWNTFPNRLFVDSGAYSIRENKIPSCQEVIKRQLLISKNWPKKGRLYFSHPDLLIPFKSSFKEYNRIINLSIDRAKLYFELHSKTDRSAIPVGVIHGFDEETLVNSYCELKSIGYQSFALGSLGLRLSRNKKLCVKAIDFAQKYNIRPLHLFGITFPINGVNYSKDIDSFDSSTPTKLAFYGTVLYGSPLRRYVIAPDSKQKLRDKSFTFREALIKPLPCKCPVCITDSNKIVSKYNYAAKRNRIIHNYFQIKWEIEKIISHGHGHLSH